MHLTYRNVNEAFRGLVGMFADTDEGPCRGDIIHSRQSRNGPVLVADEPMTITYTRPRERVLFNAARDANPFFHLYEALWILAGRNEVGPLSFYNSRISEFSDDGRTMNGAYGYRWRNYAAPRSLAKPGDELINSPNSYGLKTRVDQLDLLVSHLKADPSSRRAVLSMWNVEDDLMKIGSKDPGTCDVWFHSGDRVGGGDVPPGAEVFCRNHRVSFKAPDPCPGGRTTARRQVSKDVCCNLSVMFSVRENAECPTCSGEWTDGRARELGEQPPSLGGVCPNCGDNPMNPYVRGKSLDMTVVSRSEDLLWGLLGSDYVCFSFLQEYVAARLGTEVGRYSHFTSNLHVYTGRRDWKPGELLSWYRLPRIDEYAPGKYWKPIPLVHNSETFERELPRFVDQFPGEDPPEDLESHWEEPFLDCVAKPLLTAFAYYKREDFRGAYRCVNLVAADDWKVAAGQWLRKREGKRIKNGE